MQRYFAMKAHYQNPTCLAYYGFFGSSSSFASLKMSVIPPNPWRESTPTRLHQSRKVLAQLPYHSKQHFGDFLSVCIELFVLLLWQSLFILQNIKYYHTFKYRSPWNDVEVSLIGVGKSACSFRNVKYYTKSCSSKLIICLPADRQVVRSRFDALMNIRTCELNFLAFW